MTDPDRPLRRDAERNRQLILATAWSLVSEHGLEVTHHDIAAAAGVGVGTVYRHFPARDQLMAALFADHVDAVVKLAEAARNAEDPWEGLHRFIEQDLEVQSTNRGLSELLRGGEKDSQVTRRARVRIAPVVGELVERAQVAGQLADDIAPGDFVLVEMMVASVMDAARTFAPELWRRALALALDGLRAGHRLPGVSPDAGVMDELWGAGASRPHPSARRHQSTASEGKTPS